MLIACDNCGEVLSCTNRLTLCEDCIEQEYEEETGQMCQAKEANDWPELIICPVCRALLILNKSKLAT